jgi:hypothetical protein
VQVGNGFFAQHDRAKAAAVVTGDALGDRLPGHKNASAWLLSGGQSSGGNAHNTMVIDFHTGTVWHLQGNRVLLGAGSDDEG